MKKYLFFLIMTVAFKSNAQLVVNLQLPPIALTLKTQLWTMALINTGGANMQLKADVTLTDITNNVLVMTASSGEFQISPGTRQMQAADFMPLIYNVASSAYNIDNSTTGFLPVGHYNICYQFSRITGDNVEVLAEECETIEIEPLSPPVLVFPEEDAVLEINRPVFSWIPPAPLNLFSNLSYDIRLVEVMNTQSPADAVQQNIALFAGSNIISQFIPYPSALPALDTGKLYAWQITAKNNNSFIAKSDVWSFQIGQFGNEGQDYLSGDAYAKLKLDGFANYFLCTGALKIHYENHLSDDTVQLAIYDLANPETALSLDSNYLLIQPGQNLIKIDLRLHEGFINDHLYLFELINSRKEKWTGKFLYKKQQ